MYFVLELLIALIATYLFIDKEKPKKRFLFYGYAMFLVAAILQIPFRYLQAYFADLMNTNFLPVIVLALGPIIISELTKYFSLKRFLKTKSYKNAILFGIGWSTIESINVITIAFFTYAMKLLNLNFTHILSVSSSVPMLDFIYLFIINVSITVFVIFAILKKKLHYLAYAILYSLLVYVSLIYLTGTFKYGFALLTFAYSLYVIYNYKKIK